MIQLRRIVGASMMPSYKHGQFVLVSELKQPKQGDVVVALQGNREVIKRVVAIHHNWQVDLRGDNSSQSTDSRTLGTVPLRHIIGVVVWPKRHLQ